MERAIPHLPADDLAVAKEFYVTKLGFQVAFEASDDGRSGILGLTRGGIHITVDSPMEGHGRNACVSLEVDNADVYFAEWSAKVDVLRPPRDESWGARTFDLLDPFGNTLFVMGPVGQESGRAAFLPAAMAITRVAPILKVTNMHSAIEFYGSTLGFVVDFSYSAGSDGPRYVGVSLDGHQIHLSTFAGDGLTGTSAYFYVGDVDALFRRFLAAGLKTRRHPESPVDEGPVDQTWGMREVYVRDPDGNTLRFGTPIPQPHDDGVRPS